MAWGVSRNSGAGITIETNAANTAIGGVAPGAGNTVAFNQGVGILVNGTAGSGNAILGNRVFSNTALGIDLGNDGVTVNDVGDGDAGPNALQNCPVLTLASISGTQLSLAGTFNSIASTQFRIEFFASTVQDGTGHGEGQRYLGYLNVTTDGAGNALINTTLTATVAVGEFVSATATKSNAGFTVFTDTSEFAQNVVARLPLQAPVNTVPGAQSTNEDVAKVFSSGNGNQISIADADAGGANNQVTISVTNGSLTLSGVAGLSFIVGDGSANSTMTFRGTAAAINTALNGLSYIPTADYNGGATLTLTTKDSVLLSLDIDTALKGRYDFENTGALGTDTSPVGGTRQPPAASPRSSTARAATCSAWLVPATCRPPAISAIQPT